MAPLPSSITPTLLPRSCSNDRYGCGSIPADKRPILIVVGVIVGIIVISVFLYSCGCCKMGRGTGTGAGTETNNNNNAQAGRGDQTGPENSGDGNTPGNGAVPDGPPPMYEETGAPPPTYQGIDAGAPAESAVTSVERPQPRYA